MVSSWPSCSGSLSPGRTSPTVAPCPHHEPSNNCPALCPAITLRGGPKINSMCSAFINRGRKRSWQNPASVWVYWITGLLLKSSVIPTFPVKPYVWVKYFKSSAALGRRWSSAGSVPAPLWCLPSQAQNSGKQRLKTPTNPSWSLGSGCSDPVKADAPWLTHWNDALPWRPLTFLGAPHSPQAPRTSGLQAGLGSTLSSEASPRRLVLTCPAASFLLGGHCCVPD